LASGPSAGSGGPWTFPAKHKARDHGRVVDKTIGSLLGGFQVHFGGFYYLGVLRLLDYRFEILAGQVVLAEAHVGVASIEQAIDVA
jgi:hypothetical protein